MQKIVSYYYTTLYPLLISFELVYLNRKFEKIVLCFVNTYENKEIHTCCVTNSHDDHTFQFSVLKENIIFFILSYIYARKNKYIHCMCSGLPNIFSKMGLLSEPLYKIDKNTWLDERHLRIRTEKT